MLNNDHYETTPRGSQPFQSTHRNTTKEQSPPQLFQVCAYKHIVVVPRYIPFSPDYHNRNHDTWHITKRGLVLRCAADQNIVHICIYTLHNVVMVMALVDVMQKNKNKYQLCVLEKLWKLQKLWLVKNQRNVVFSALCYYLFIGIGRPNTGRNMLMAQPITSCSMFLHSGCGICEIFYCKYRYTLGYTVNSISGSYREIVLLIIIAIFQCHTSCTFVVLFVGNVTPSGVASFASQAIQCIAIFCEANTSAEKLEMTNRFLSYVKRWYLYKIFLPLTRA